jgi:glutathione S-transferase
MTTLPFTVLVTVAALIFYFISILRVGHARTATGIAAPAMTGDPVFERHVRVQMNTLEWLPLFLAGLWMFASFHGDLIAAALGMVWIVGRILFMLAYVADPKKRAAGFIIQMLATTVLLIGAGAGAVMALL